DILTDWYPGIATSVESMEIVASIEEGAAGADYSVYDRSMRVTISDPRDFTAVGNSKWLEYKWHELGHASEPRNTFLLDYMELSPLVKSLGVIGTLELHHENDKTIEGIIDLEIDNLSVLAELFHEGERSLHYPDFYHKLMKLSEVLQVETATNVNKFEDYKNLVESMMSEETPVATAFNAHIEALRTMMHVLKN